MALSFGGGTAIAALNYALSRYVLKKHPKRYFAVQIVRQLLQISYLVLLFVCQNAAPCDVAWLLVGGGAGITLPMFWFTYKLVKLNGSLYGKEDSSDG